MEYILRVPKIVNGVIPLVLVADVMARAKATGYGSTDFHSPTYDNVFRGIGTSLTREAKSGNLTVCDNNGFAQPVNDVLEQGMRDGAFNAVSRYIVEPNWAQLEAQHPEAEILPGCWHWGGIDIGGESVPDVLMSELHYFHTSLHYLNEWGCKAGNTFTFVEMPVKMVDFDLTDIAGNVIEAGYYRGFVGASNLAGSPKAAMELTEAVSAVTGCVTMDIFLTMKNLTADEVSITFVGDKTESGIGVNNLLEITARGNTRHIALAAIDLIDLHRRSLNSQGVILLGMAQKMILPSTGSNRKKISRLREVFRIHLGIISDPFYTYRKSAGWEPRFKIYDNRGAADERARREAERHTTSYEQLLESGEKIGSSSQSHHSFDSENDDADDWLKNNDPDAPA